MGQDIKPVMSFVRLNHLGNDLIYVYHGAEPAFKFYAPSYNLDGNYVIGIQSILNPNKYLEELDGLEKGRRIWFIFSNNCSGCIVDEQVFILEHLDKIGVRMTEYEAAGASGYLYELMQTP